MLVDFRERGRWRERKVGVTDNTDYLLYLHRPRIQLGT